MIHGSKSRRGGSPCSGRSRILALMIMATWGVSASVAQADDSWSFVLRLTSDTSAREVGDLVTVIIEEEAESSLDASSQFSKNSHIGGNISAGRPRIDDRPSSWTNAVLPSYSLDTGHSYEGGGSSSSSDRLTTRMAARVTEVLPNGNLLIEGKRSIIVQEEFVEMLLTGTVRPRDISSDNTVESTRIADATIKYESNGPIERNRKRGLITRLWHWINPF